MNIPERATKEQTEAITQTEGNIRVASVPGSGKTFVLTYRIAYLITELFVEPSSIAVSYTHLDVYKRQQLMMIMASCLHAGILILLYVMKHTGQFIINIKTFLHILMLRL